MLLSKKKISEEKRRTRVKNRRVHMANERTFLAWIRTSIGIMAFGFVIEKFVVPSAVFSRVPNRSAAADSDLLAALGISLVFLGAAASLLATYRFIRNEKDITEDTYHPSIVPDILVALLIGSVGCFLVIYLVNMV